MRSLTVQPAFMAQSRGSPPHQVVPNEKLRLQIGAFHLYWKRGGLNGVPTLIHATLPGEGEELTREVSRLFAKITAIDFDAPNLTIKGIPHQNDGGPPIEEMPDILIFGWISIPKGEEAK